jgi:hypothetical protein
MVTYWKRTFPNGCPPCANKELGGDCPEKDWCLIEEKDGLKEPPTKWRKKDVIRREGL